ncbi:MAG TPA: metalloregulator ArsR/SmtB family transcription factor [Candidatus Dormibacteraeota bacterium]
MQDAAAVASLARVLADETRVRLLDELTAGEASVSDLACRLGIDQPRVSTHLQLLRSSGLVDAHAHGRARVYALRGEAPVLALSTLRTLAGSPAPLRSRAAAAAVQKDAPIRRARTCYDHLAGVAGVQVLDALLGRGWLRAQGERFELTAAGEEGLAAEGIDLAEARRARRAFAVGCLDWTERRVHLGGALGAAVLRHLLATRQVRLQPGSRVVHMKAGALWTS